MDLERIKQNLRIRSGRNKQKKKSTKKPPNPPALQKPVQPSSSLLKGEVDEGGKERQEHTAQQQETEDPGLVPPSERTTEQEQVQNTDVVNGYSQVEQELDLPSKSTSEHRLGSTNIPTDPVDFTDQDETSNDIDPIETSHTMNEEQLPPASPASEVEDFDLKPPKPRPKPPSIESLADLLFSADHLNALLHSPPQLSLFSTFLQKYVPDSTALLSQYLETQKAIRAVEYANAVADGLKPEDIGDGAPTEVRKAAATLDPEFEAICNSAFNALVNIALPRFVTYQLIKICSECLTNEITGRQSAAKMQDFVGGLSEVFVLSDPHQEDNPIIYASEEFYRLTGYGEEDVIGNNCRFLQGKKTNPESPRRLREAIDDKEAIYETILNYRRDGRPFINMLMIAPLFDKAGKVKYHIGAQLDVSGLVEGGRALPGFQRFLNRRNNDQKRSERQKARRNEQSRNFKALARLRDLSEMFDLEESAIVRETSRANSLTREDDDNRSIGSADRQRRSRRVLQDSDGSEDEHTTEQNEDNSQAWKLSSSVNGKISGQLPGIYESFMLFRPYPSLRIVFLSPKLRKFNKVLQTPMLSHIAAPGSILSGVHESLKTGEPVSAKVHFMPERGVNREGTKLKRGTKHEDGKHGKAFWISCTPLLGADGRIGVWMCVVVEKSTVADVKRSPPTYEQEDTRPEDSVEGSGNRTQPNQLTAGDVPIKPVRIDSDTIIETVTEKVPETPTGRRRNNILKRPVEDVDLMSRMEAVSLSQPDVSSPNPGELVAHPEQPSTKDSEQPKVSKSEGYFDQPKKPKPYSVEIPNHDLSANSAGVDEIETEEYVTTRSPLPSVHTPGRILIEEDKDSFVDYPAQSRTQDGDGAKSSSASPVWSPASEIPPSIPSDAQFSNGEEDLSRVATATPSKRSSITQDQDRAQDEEAGRSHEADAKNKSQESIVKPTSVPPSAYREQEPSSPDDHEEDATLLGQSSQTDSRDDDSRPTTAVDSSASNNPTAMDYILAGSERWQQGRNAPRVDMTNVNTSLADPEDPEDGFSDIDCSRSPYSID